MKFRKYNWFDIKKRAVKYGIQAHHNGQWENCCDGKEPLIFDKEKDRVGHRCRYYSGSRHWSGTQSMCGVSFSGRRR